MQSPPSQDITQSRIRRGAPAWSGREVVDLIACWGEEFVMAELRSKKSNTNTYAKVSRAMTERGYSRDTEQCRTKIKELRQAYQKAREANGHSGSQPHTFRFYCELHAVMGSDATTTPPLSVDTCKWGVARSEEEETLEDEKEEEEEDSAQAASGESVSPPSQELILTLDPIASPHSQGGLLFHDPGEGTSGANVSMRPLSTPSQRLVQIRRQKKRTRDDMFAELMQSSRTARAQLNAWRQTIVESRELSITGT
ncbi:myb/SANT-like DNA-binding domain-containing protein 2 [Mauremys mutica]|uniref:myb/SANT-like DNA-binding domain-containing protein 2 n=1 Tax=Mauremys mutica TaxID=74926 RepID=UPI001D169F71|nr:myb/SANT-like DNA-binding domain-containing protein 2 [Mauremys mutica]